MISSPKSSSFSCVSRTLLLFFFVFCALSPSLFGGPPQSGFDLRGNSVDPLKSAKGKIVVLIFVRTDCPISNRYAPLLQHLHESYAAKANFWLVYPGKKATAAGISEHLKQFHFTIPALRDPQHSFVKLASATITPEAAVFDAQGRLLYHGRIDNLYEDPARSRSAATTHELQDALDAAANGKPSPFATAPAVGCYISDLE